MSYVLDLEYYNILPLCDRDKRAMKRCGETAAAVIFRLRILWLRKDNNAKMVQWSGGS